MKVLHRFSGAVLYDGDLLDANLRDADLLGADLRDANLLDANLRGANLRDADLLGVVLPDGYSWEIYLAEVIPSLIRAGEAPLGAVLAAWDCHSWSNCPMSIAFNARMLDDVPALYRRQAAQFIHFFDNGLIPLPQSVTALPGGTA